MTSMAHIAVAEFSLCFADNNLFLLSFSDPPRFAKFVIILFITLS